MIRTTQVAYRKALGTCDALCACHILHWRMGERPGLISVRCLISSSIMEFSISSALGVLEVLCCLYWQFLSNRSQHVTVNGCQSILFNVVAGQEYRRKVFWAHYCSSCTTWCFFLFCRINWLVMPMTPYLLLLIVPSPGIRVTVAESPNRDLGTFREWCDLREPKIMIVSIGHAQCNSSHPHKLWEEMYWRTRMTMIYWDSHLIPRRLLRSIFARFLEQLLKGLVSWGCPG